MHNWGLNVLLFYRDRGGSDYIIFTCWSLIILIVLEGSDHINYITGV